MRSLPIILACVLLCAFMFSATSMVRGEETKPDLQAVIHETQQQSNKQDEMVLIWWIPVEYWVVSFSQDKSMSPEDINEFLAAIRPYNIVGVIDGKMGPLAGMKYRSEAETRADLKLRDKNGVSYAPLADAKLNEDTKNLLGILRPVLVNMLGPMGKNFNFYCFPAKNAQGQMIADAKKDGAFSVLLGTREFKWRLPLGSLLPPKNCPKCNEKLSGAYQYCPWDGTKLP